VPELPDITIYIEALEKRILDTRLQRVQLASPFLLRTATPPISSLEGRAVIELRRLGKRICLGFEDDLWMVLHLMIAGRLHWKDPAAKAAAVARPSASAQFARLPKNTLAIFHFENGQLLLTEAGTQRRASLHIVQGAEGLHALDPGGLKLFYRSANVSKRVNDSTLGRFIDLPTFTRILQSENHTLKRALTDPRLFSGVGNAYSDEILWHARLSPVKLTQKLTEEEVTRLHAAIRDTLIEWVERLREETGGNFPEKVTAFRKDMASHGRYREPCPRCGSKIQRIRYASNETNYCPNCQTGGKLLADRALSRLLREDWPKRADEFA
jgi:formamidopyrimidine-DNA glycosylase